MGLILTDSILLDGQRYRVANHVIHRRTIFPEQSYQVQKDVNKPDFSDLHPAIHTYDIPDFSEGLGLWIDQGREFSRRCWYSSLRHDIRDQITLQDLKQAAGTIPPVNQILPYKTGLYALTNSGLYLFNTGNSTFEAVAGTPANAMVHACVHRNYLVIARGSANNVVLFDGTNFTNPAVGQTASVVADLDDRLFVGTPMDANGVFRVRYTEDIGATAYKDAIFIGATQSTLPTSADPTGIAVGPDGTGLNQIYIATPSAAWLIDYRVGVAQAIHIMGTNDASNGKVCLFWPTTRKLYVNEKATLVEIDLYGLTQPVGPNPTVTPVTSVKIGLPDGYQAVSLKGFTYDSNWIVVGTDPNAATDKALILKMSPDHKWYFVATGTTAGENINAVCLNGNSGDRLFFAEGAGSNNDVKFLDFRGQFAASGELHTPWLTMGMPEIQKWFLEAIVDQTDLSANETITISYRVDYNEYDTIPFATFTSTSSNYARTFGTTVGYGLQARAIKFVISMARGGTNTLTPKQLHMRLRWRPKPTPVYVYDMDLAVNEAADPYAELVDLLEAITTSFADKGAVEFKQTGDADEAVQMVIPLMENRDASWEQLRKEGKAHISLITVATENGGNTTGPYNNTSPQYLYPTFFGDTNEWTTGTPQDVDDPQPQASNDGDTTYMENVAANGGDDNMVLFKHTTLVPLPSGQAITQVTLNTVSRWVANASGTLKTRIKIGSTVYTNSTLTALTSGNANYKLGSVTFTTSPATGVAWTAAEIQSLQFGVYLDVDGAATHRLTQCYLTVDYA